MENRIANIFVIFAVTLAVAWCFALWPWKESPFNGGKTPKNSEKSNSLPPLNFVRVGLFYYRLNIPWNIVQWSRESGRRGLRDGDGDRGSSNLPRNNWTL